MIFWLGSQSLYLTLPDHSVSTEHVPRRRGGAVSNGGLSTDIRSFIEVSLFVRDAHPARICLCSEVGRGEESMRIALNIAASLLVLAGVTWFLQGINVLPGSFMTGQIRRAVYGGVAFAVGIALLLLG